MPGSGGDVGYSFLKQLIGTETVKAENHNNFTPDAMKSITGEDWEEAGDHTLRAGREITSSELDYENYRCYLMDDELNDPRKPENSGNRAAPVSAVELGISDPNLSDTAFCLPYDGMPGAVVIVW